VKTHFFENNNRFIVIEYEDHPDLKGVNISHRRSGFMPMRCSINSKRGQQNGKPSISINSRARFMRLVSAGGYMISQEALMVAWLKVQQNDGCAGADGVTIAEFQTSLFSNLSALQSQLESGRYAPKPLLRVILKKGLKRRPLSIPSVADRVVQTAVANYLTPLFEPLFEDISFAYRAGRSVDQAIARVVRYYQAGFEWVVDADIDSYFDEVDHESLLLLISKTLDKLGIDSSGQGVANTAKIVNLVTAWLTCTIVEGKRRWTNSKGIPQGSPLSPLLANLYLDQLDDALIASDKKIVRFADDFLILCKSKEQAERCEKMTGDILARLQLQFNQDKTQVVHFNHGFQFLGWQFIRSMVFKAAKPENTSNTSVSKPKPIDSPSTDTGDNRRLTAMAHAWQEALEEQAAVAQENKSVSQEASPVSQEPSPVSQEPSPVSQEPSPVSLETSPVSQETSPVSQEPSAVLSEPSAVLSEPSAVLSEVPPDSSKPLSTTAELPLKNTSPNLDEVSEQNGVELDVLQKTLYLTRNDLAISKRSKRLIIEWGELKRSIALIQVDQIVVFGNAQFTTPAIRLCLRQGVGIHFLSNNGYYQGQLHSPNFQRSLLHKAQYRRQSDLGFIETVDIAANGKHTIEFCHALIGAKCSNSITILRRIKRRATPALSDTISLQIGFMSKQQQNLSKAQAIDTLLGYEGVAAKAYFTALGQFFEEHGWAWPGRQARSAIDPLNVLFNFLYSLLYNNVIGLIFSSGLNPYIGYLHSAKTNHAALASDLMEPFRSIVVDHIVIACVRDKAITPDNFSMVNGQCRIDKAGIDLLIHRFEARVNQKFGFTRHNAKQAESENPLNSKKTDLRRIMAEQITQTKSWVLGEQRHVNFFKLK
jgi:group II intron reverse transcriptase/maturase/CRISPR-associated endonuclease Cas1